eukprot:TRINITY_DN18225_c0_g1_i1.p1 TRINITY_DN18225_c0_g1~~TRINITY_DN18225_c0_g1_i1.p1  ORF type:complete len:332 (+),score=83.72 TRINITY_DN18225_c0_g1_i1:83-1078(+)
MNMTSSTMQSSGTLNGKEQANLASRGVAEEISEEEDDGFEPLFSYNTVFDPNFVPAELPKAKTKPARNRSESPKAGGRGKTPQPTSRRGKAKKESKPLFVLCLSDDDEEEEDVVIVGGGWRSEKAGKKWSGSREGKEKDDHDDILLPPPPPIYSDSLNSDPTLASIRQKRASLSQVPLNSARASEEVERAARARVQAEAKIEEEAAIAARHKASLMRRTSSGLGSSGGSLAGLAPSSSSGKDSATPLVADEARVREKVRLVVQTEDDVRETFSICKDDKLEKLFTAYKKKLPLDQASKCIFKFDGERIDPSASAASLDMEDEDMIEVSFKR